MKKIVYYSSALIMITAFCFLFLLDDKGMFIAQLVASVAIMLCYPNCKEKQHFIVIILFSTWVAVFDIIFILLLLFNSDSIFLGSDLSLLLQFGLPFFASVIFKAANQCHKTKR